MLDYCDDGKDMIVYFGYLNSFELNLYVFWQDYA
jgi:hypothetical protein